MFGFFKKDDPIKTFSNLENQFASLLNQYDYPIVRPDEIRCLAFAFFAFFTFSYQKNAQVVCDKVATAIVQIDGNQILDKLRQRNAFYKSYLEEIVGVRQTNNTVPPHLALALELFGSASTGFNPEKTNVLSIGDSMFTLLVNFEKEIKRAKFS